MKMKLLCLLFFSFGYKNINAQHLSETMLTGKVLKPVKDYMLLYYERNLGFENFKDTIRISNDGSFKYQWKFDPSFVAGRLDVSPTVTLQLWAIDKGNIELTIADSTNLCLFSGGLGIYNQFLNIDARRYQKNIEQYYRKRNPGAVYSDSLDNNYYYRVEDSIFSERIRMADNFTPFKNESGGNEFLWFYKNHEALRYAGWKLQGEGNILRYKQFQRKPLIKSLPVPFNCPDIIDFGDSNIYKISAIQFYLRDYLFLSNFALKKKYKPNISFTWDSVYANTFQMINKMEQPGTIANSMMKATFMKKEVELINSRPYQEDTTEYIYQKYVDQVLNDSLVKNQSIELSKLFRRKLNELGKLKKGTPAPNVKLINEKGELVSWEKYKGKLLYIDVWASWCGPCIAELPYWNELVRKYKDDPRIAFVTVSIDDKSEQWIKALKKYKPEGEYLLGEGGFEGAFSNAFNIKSVPANIIIDANGKIYQQRAERAKEIDLEKLMKGN